MKIIKIISDRKKIYGRPLLFWKKKKDSFSCNLVWEWEDIISQICNISIKYETTIGKGILKIISLSNFFCFFYNLFQNKNTLALYFVMKVELKPNARLNKSRVPVVIDFWLKENELSLFYKLYKKCPLIIITSKEVFDILKRNNCPLHIIHIPLSLPDKYFLDENKLLTKEYDLTLSGRVDEYFKRMLERYCTEYPEFVYIKNNGVGNKGQYITNKGEFICDSLRDNYFKMIKKSKIAFYSTPGIDESKKNANNYNQVTPRFLELLSGGCYILAHYPVNSDTEYYAMSTICDNIHSYEQFRERMNFYRSTTELPIKRNAQYLKNHYTSYIANLLKKELAKANLI
jgi:hypothetical protein